MNVPFIDILRYEVGFLESVTGKVYELIRQGHFVGGPVVETFEQKIKNYTRANFVVGCANGTDAIQVALRAAGVKKEQVVLLPDMTFWATFEAIVNVGALPVTVDVSPTTLHLTYESVKMSIEKFHPRAIIAVHLYGHSIPEIKKIRELCSSKNVILIEDCAQAVGVKVEGESLIGEADIATTSFYPAKVLGASGDAGAIFFKDQKIAENARQLINHGRINHYEHGLVGWNSRLGAYEACFLNECLNYIDARLESRRRICEIYRSNISSEKFNFITPAKGILENGYLSVALMKVDERGKFIEYLKEKKIGYGTVYPGAMSKQPGAQEYLHGHWGESAASEIAHSVINLPCFPYMKDEEIQYVIDSVNLYS